MFGFESIHLIMFMI